VYIDISMDRMLVARGSPARMSWTSSSAGLPIVLNSWTSGSAGETRREVCMRSIVLNSSNHDT
jgi:hypothetical protein